MAPVERKAFRSDRIAVAASDAQTIAAQTLSGLPATMIDLLTDARHDLRAGLTLPAHGVVWLCG